MNLHRDAVSITSPPILVVEILSYGQALGEIIDRTLFYLDHGVKSVWMIAPPLRTVMIFLPDGSQQGYHEGVVRDPVTGLTADLDILFA